MSYSRPAGGSADRQFPSGSTYLRPAGLTADAQFPSDFAASGFEVGVAFGTPFANIVQEGDASGFLTSQFGTPNVLPGYVPGFLAGGVGAPLGAQRWMAASVGQLTRFSTAYYAFAQAAEPAGFAPVRFGTPIGTTSVEVIPTTLVSAVGFRTGALGVPAGITLAATGWLAGAFGSPGHLRRQAATGWQATSLGAPQAAAGYLALGFRSGALGGPSAGFLRAFQGHGFLGTRLGAPTTFRPSLATAISPRTRLGTPTAAIPNGYRAYGINASGRVGTPRCTANVPGYPASGFLAGAIGSPYALQRHRALHLPPVTLFGRPRLDRSTAC